MNVQLMANNLMASNLMSSIIVTTLTHVKSKVVLTVVKTQQVVKSVTHVKWDGIPKDLFVKNVLKVATAVGRLIAVTLVLMIATGLLLMVKEEHTVIITAWERTQRFGMKRKENASDLSIL